MTKIAVISDLHANALALKICLNEIKKKNVDLLICLGDILTYGTQPNEVIDELLQYQKMNDLIMIKGNHEEFYFSSSKLSQQDYSLPNFVEESINWTKANLQYEDLKNLFSWRQSYIFRDIYFAHANPFNYGNWSYVENSQQIEDALQSLKRKNRICGVFGHSHRQYIRKGRKLMENSYDTLLDEIDEPLIVNTGSAGQSRGSGFCYSLIRIDSKKIYIDLKKFCPNIEENIKDVHLTDMSNNTKSRLEEYLRK